MDKELRENLRKVVSWGEAHTDWKKAIEGMGATFSVKTESASAACVAEVQKLPAKIGQLVG